MNLSSVRTVVMVSAFLLVSLGRVSGEETITFSDALLRTLSDNPGVMIEKQVVRQQEGILTTASGEFDWLASGGWSTETKTLPLPYSQEKTEEHIVYSVGFGKKFRNGIVVQSSVAAVDFQDDFAQKTPVNRSDINADVIIPLLRGRGTKSAGAQELAARSNLSATERLTMHNISRRMLTTAEAFWQCLAAHDVVSLYEETEKRDERLVEVVTVLVESGELSRAYLEQAKAKLYKTRADINSARLDLYKTRQKLGVALGIGADVVVPPPLPEGPFPGLVDSTTLSTDSGDAYIRMARDKRGDYLATLTTLETENILLEESKNNLLPKLDFNVRAGYAGMYEDDGSRRYYRSIHDDLKGLNTFMSFKVEMPVINKVAKGDVIYRKSQVRKAELSAGELSGVIASEVRIAVETLRRAVNEYRLAKLSAESYQVVVDHEDRQVRSGESNLTNLIEMQDRYLEARLAEKNAEMKYTIALVQLRYVTGSMFADGRDRFFVDPDTMLELPVREQ